MHRARIAITLLWWSWGLLIVALMIAMSLNSSFYGDDLGAAWKWFIPGIFPALTLVGATAYAAPASDADAPLAPERVVAFRLTIVISLLYLLALTVAVLAQFFIVTPLIDHLRRTSLWLAPLQALAAGSVGVFFTRKA